MDSAIVTMVIDHMGSNSASYRDGIPIYSEGFHFLEILFLLVEGFGHTHDIFSGIWRGWAACAYAMETPAIWLLMARYWNLMHQNFAFYASLGVT